MSVFEQTFIKPRALRSGATLAVISPASTPKRELVERGIAELEAAGYRTRLGKYAFGGGPLYYAGTWAERLEDIHAAFADDSVDGIICTRGGWGSAELLPHLNADLIRSNPKAFIGYSDHSSLHCWLQNEANLTSFYGPMVAADFAREGGVDPASWRNTFEGASGWSLDSEDGLRVLQPGVADGRLLGGCISILAAGLGTPFAPRLTGSVLFLEDIGTKPYQWDRMLLHLRYSGRLEDVRGIVFGDMTQCADLEEQDLLERAILHGLRGFQGPVAIGLRCGHVDGANRTLPLGVQVQLDLTDGKNPRLTFLEAAVSG
ncbi:S66 peptidase family protein [Edaphobacter modestus]|uniref:Muramoyltetrapeptide carboxypeptidase n=1 Tax=Edaphobacter modestus TaxID=388466 RepID=A0A4Q7YYW5_9BACT|nr:LD-carboxypeptidase [Edaphobacter modestus]RZU42684.1 muramoyltetrapeptide carboxypeptidase [Edaphobacter modestus]